MRKNFGSQTWLFPMPVLIIGTYDADGTPDAMNAAWGGIYDTGKIGICLSAEHKTVKNLLAKKAFTVSFADEKHLKEADYVGIVSANDVPDKFARAGFHARKSAFVDAPIIEELPLTLECELICYDEASGYTIANIINISADEEILNEKGEVDPLKLNPLIFETVTGGYYLFGKRAGNAFSDGEALQ